jgi:hypothetical protein
MPVMPDIPKAEIAIVEQTNAFRVANKLQSVRTAPALTKAAREFAGFLSSSTLFSHEADGRRPIDRIKAAGYAPCATAENLAWHSDSRGFETLQLATATVEGWKNSPGHRKNLLMDHATETGVAIVKTRREEKYFAVQLFGRPDTLKYSFRVENTAAREVVYRVAGEAMRVAPRQIVTHTACLPAEIAIDVKAGGLLSKDVTSTYQAKGGQVYRLTGKGSEIAVEVVEK